MNNTDGMHSILELKRLSLVVSGAAGSLAHAKKQVRKYPHSDAAREYHKNKLAEFIEAHNAYIEYANQELAEEFGEFDRTGLTIDEWADA